MNMNSAYALQVLDSQKQADLLLVCPNPHDQKTLRTELAHHGYRVHQAETAGQALELHGDADLVILDLDLPDLHGIEICGEIRRRSEVPLIVISNSVDETNCVLSLRAGADDYIVKPYRRHELIARIESALRRSQRQIWADTNINFGPLSIDVRKRRASMGGSSITLTRKEFDLLCLLASQPGVVISRDTIKKRIWGNTWSQRTIDTHVNSLRRKLGRRDWIITVRGVGFVMADAECA